MCDFLGQVYGSISSLGKDMRQEKANKYSNQAQSAGDFMRQKWRIYGNCDSKIALQLSIKEGFEVKVTEALMKGKPVIAYNAGGIPLQIQDGITGYLVERGDTTLVAQHLYNLLTDESAYQRMSEAAYEYAGKDYLTIPNAISWLYLAGQLVRGEKVEGNCQWVRALVGEKYGK